MKPLSVLAVSSLLFLQSCSAHATAPLALDALDAPDARPPAGTALTLSWQLRLGCMPVAGHRWVALHHRAATALHGPHLQLVFCLPLPAVSAARK